VFILLIRGDPLPAGTGGHPPGSQSTESGLRGAVWQRSIGNFIEHLEGFSEHGISHGITAYPNK
jgi:hypothetical protein